MIKITNFEITLYRILVTTACTGITFLLWTGAVHWILAVISTITWLIVILGTWTLNITSEKENDVID